jgi:hypothetical protein
MMFRSESGIAGKLLNQVYRLSTPRQHPIRRLAAILRRLLGFAL